MGKFFDKRRLVVLQLPRLKRYLIFVTGEVFLIVVGIRIALQIDTWNGERQLRKLEYKYLEEMLADLKMESVKIIEMWKRAEPVSYASLSSDIKVNNALTTNLFYRQYVPGQYLQQKEHVLHVMALIKSELAGK